MMANLFSTFDPCTGILSLNWISIIIMLVLIPYKFWVIPNKIMLMFNKLIEIIHKEIIMIMKYKGSSLMFISTFMVILTNNMMGLLPYIFTSTSHLVFSMSIALPMWMSFMIFGWTNKTNSMFIHLVPMGTPNILMPFMVLIETISNIIRPGSLAVRLTANMIAGHLLMSLLGNNCSSINMMAVLMMAFILLMMFETAVAMIQAYVFMTLMNLYSSEI